jgi:hypothetical protein
LDLKNRKIGDLEIGRIENCSIQYNKFKASLKCEISTNVIEKRTPEVIENSSGDDDMRLKRSGIICSDKNSNMNDKTIIMRSILKANIDT